MTDVTRILNAIEQGDAGRPTSCCRWCMRNCGFWPLRSYHRNGPGQTLQATALVHEAYLRLVGEEAQDWKSRSHFFRAAAEAMRRILIDNARRKSSLNTGEHQKIDLDEAPLSKMTLCLWMRHLHRNSEKSSVSFSRTLCLQFHHPCTSI